MINIQQALVDPAKIFKSPKDVLLTNDLTPEQKIDLLHRWEYDIREMKVAEEENMIGKDSTHLTKLSEYIRAALRVLNAKEDLDETPPTKQGG